MKRRIRLTEGMLHRMIKEAINELDWKTYASAAEKQPSQYRRRYKDNQYADEVDKAYQNKLKQLGLSRSELDTKAWIKLWDEARKEVQAKEQKMADRKENFRDAAKNAFDRDFGFEDETGTLKCYDKNGKLEPHIKDIYGNYNGEPKYYIVYDSVYNPEINKYIKKWVIKSETLILGDTGLEIGIAQISPDFDTKEEAEEYAEMHHMQAKYVKPSKELQTAYQKARKEVDDFSSHNYEYEKGKGWKLKNDSLDESIHRAIRRVLR